MLFYYYFDTFDRLSCDIVTTGGGYKGGSAEGPRSQRDSLCLLRQKRIALDSGTSRAADPDVFRGSDPALFFKIITNMTKMLFD